jgi:hypothetical protein
MLEICAATFDLFVLLGRSRISGLTDGDTQQRHHSLGNSIEARSIARNISLGGGFVIGTLELDLV